jgi:hypothetical protein
MRTKDPRKKLISEHLRRFFAALKVRATEGVADLWERVENQLHKKSDDHKPSDKRK